ncbi:MAG: peptidoglycan DD-metalloendopeptidase family protein, partial [Anaerolineae bacterium]|nr:peptidoglycan DD-metalloendopeptidase family protein [Anaerolineae bacterium]
AGLDYESAVVEFNVRPEPGTVSSVVLFKCRKGQENLLILDVQPDNQGTKAPNGQVYQWFKLRFADGQEGWLRSHVLTIQGDLTRFGYGVIGTATYAYILTRVISMAAAPAPSTPPAPEPTPQTTPAPAPAPAPTAPVPPAPDPDVSESTGIISAPFGARLRDAPVTGGQLTIIAAGTRVKIIEIQSVFGEMRRWVYLEFQGQRGWMREDLIRILAETPEADLESYTSSEFYPVPMKRFRFVRGFQGPLPLHNGVDYGGDTGEPMLDGPVGGVCVASEECTKCNVPGKPSTRLQGLGLANPAVFGDKAWNFGYGHYVIIRYLNHQLPLPTRQTLADMGLGGGHIYAMYAHLSRRDVQAGDVVGPNQIIGACGDTGNSHGSHVHLELRASTSFDFPGWARIGSGLLDPLLMFKR